MRNPVSARKTNKVNKVNNIWKPVKYWNGTLYDTVKISAEKYPDYIAYSFMGKKVKYSSFLEKIDRAAAALSAIGVRENDVVSIVMPNVPQTLIMFYAANRVGAVVQMIHPLSSPRELEDFLNQVNSETIIIMEQFYHVVKELREKTGLKNVIVAGVKEALPFLKKLPYAVTEERKIIKPEKTDDILFFSDFMKIGKNKLPVIPNTDRTHLPAVILHSGGTTGKTKAILHSNYAVNASAAQMKAAEDVMPGSKMLTIMPVFHGNGLVIAVHLILHSGGTCVLIPRFTPESYAKDMLKYKCEYTSGVPSLFKKVIDAQCMKKADLSFLKGVFSGADSLPVNLQIILDDFLHNHGANISVRQGYGMTEGVVATTLNPNGKEKEGSIGVPLQDVTLKIVEPGTDRELPQGEVGEIVFSSVTNMMGYYNDLEETENTLKKHSDGLVYVHSGDLGSVDSEGYVFFCGRIKNMIVTNGYNVFPLEIEMIIQKHPAVKQCCVIGVQDSERMEKVVVFIRPNEIGQEVEQTKEELKAFFRKNIARYAIPRDILFIDSFPVTKVGKIDINRLKDMYLEMTGMK